MYCVAAAAVGGAGYAVQYVNAVCHGLGPETFGRVALLEMRAHLGEDREYRALGNAIQGVDFWWRLDLVDAVLVE